ncbi:F-box domain-containing protein [Mycena kentingensis (nom. inval.)]|nr:F-box domain-containing protein [Mycena kentingensis (nom. inval.)]
MTEPDIPALRIRASQLTADIARKEEELAQLAELLALPASAAKIRQLDQRRLEWLRPEAKRVVWTRFALLSEQAQDAFLARAAVLNNEGRMKEQRSTLKRDYESLLAELAPIKAELDNIVYPVLSIPAEITSEIFFHLCFETSMEGNCTDPDAAPLLLLRVCRAWRSIATSTPSLWSSFKVKIKKEDSAFPIDRLPQLLETWLVRARSCSVLLELVVHPELSTDLPPGTLHAIHRHAWHIRELKLEGFSVSNLHIATQNASFPRLVVLELTTYDFSDLEEKYSELFSDAPQLTSFTMMMNAQITPTPGLVPWSQLGSFTGKQFTNQGAIDVLRLLPRVPICTLDMTFFSDDADEIPPSSPTITLKRLHSLSLRQTDDLDVPLAILNVIFAPALHSLQVNGLYPTQYSILATFLQQTSIISSLRELSLSMVSENTCTPMPVHMLPNLRVTSLVFNKLLHTCARDFFVCMAGPSFLPVLEELKTSSSHSPRQLDEFLLFELDFYVDPPTVLALALPWSSSTLTRIEMRQILTKDCVSVLRAAPSVIDAYFCIDKDLDELDVPLVVHPSLHHLTLGSPHYDRDEPT